MVRLFTSLHDTFLRLTSWLDWGPATDPNKVAPIMVSSDDWPDWCLTSQEAPKVIDRSILRSLLKDDPNQRTTTLVGEVESIRLKRLTHYKRLTAWDHEFIRADFHQSTTNKSLIFVWERNVELGQNGKKEVHKIKAGVNFEAKDNVWYPNENSFNEFIKGANSTVAQKLRTATFSDQEPTFLEVAAVLKTHSVSIPKYHIYSTMCYWYADSTFAALVEMSRGNVDVKYHDGSLQGKWKYASFEADVYTGITLKKPKAPVNDAAYLAYVVGVQTTVFRRYDSEDITWFEDKSEKQSEQGKKAWNVVRFLRLIKDIPSFDKLLEDSKVCAAEVRKQLEDKQAELNATLAYSRDQNVTMAKKLEDQHETIEGQQRRINEQQKTQEEQQRTIDEQRKTQGEQTRTLNEVLKKMKEMEETAQKQRKEDADRFAAALQSSMASTTKESALSVAQT